MEQDKTICRLIIDPTAHNMRQEFTVVAIFESEDGKIKQGEHIGRFDNLLELAEWIVKNKKKVAIYNHNIKWGGR